MKFRPEDFNIAPQSRQPVPLAWLLLAGGAVALGLSAFALNQSLDIMHEAQFRAEKLRIFTQRQAQALQRAKLEEGSAANQERAKARTQILSATQMSWNGIFNALELAAQAVHGGVSITTLVPTSVQSSSAQINLTALAANTPVMWAYIEALQDDPRISQVELTTNQPDMKTAPSVLRFQVSLTWSPKLDSEKPDLSPLSVQMERANRSFLAHQAARQ